MLKAKHFWNRGTEDALNQAVALFQEAIDRDSSFAISEAIIKALQPKLTSSPAANRHSPDSKAYQSYLKAKHFWNRGTEDALNQAVALFQEAHLPLSTFAPM